MESDSHQVGPSASYSILQSDQNQSEFQAADWPRLTVCVEQLCWSISRTDIRWSSVNIFLWMWSPARSKHSRCDWSTMSSVTIRWLLTQWLTPARKCWVIGDWAGLNLQPFWHGIPSPQRAVVWINFCLDFSSCWVVPCLGKICDIRPLCLVVQGVKESPEQILHRYFYDDEPH